MTDDYRLSHRAPGPDEEGTTVSLDRLGGQEDTVFPRDVLTHPDWYGGTYQEAINQIRAVARSADRDQLVTVYRAVPLGVTKINPGDWVALSRTYALNESYRTSTDGTADGNVISARTPASTLYSEGYLEEWGYQGEASLEGKPLQPAHAQSHERELRRRSVTPPKRAIRNSPDPNTGPVVNNSGVAGPTLDF